jgi:hypothetical protein
MLDRKILSITKPTIPIDQMDYNNTTDPKNPVTSNVSRFKEAGAIFPLIEINKHQFDEKEVESFYLDETGFIPRVRVGVTITDGVFLSKYFPKDGDPMSILIRSMTDEFKPIRCDFEITLVNAFPSKSESGDVQAFTIEGVLRIPGLYGEWCKTFKKTSYDSIIDICNELKVGFASNEIETTDKQTWINPFDTYEKFLIDITSASYKDDESFFKGFFDHYYFYNFVNMNNQFSDEFELEDAIETLTFNDDFLKDKRVEKIDTQIMLFNHNSMRATGNYIKGYTLVNKAGQVVIDNGYRRFLQYYDSELQKTNPKEKYQSYFVEPLSTKGTDNKILLKGRTKEDFYGKADDRSDSKYNKYKFMGNQTGLPGGNCHDNYFQAVLQNRQNNEEIEKMMLRVNLGKCNFNLYRGQRVPVLIVNIANTSRQKQTADDSQGTNDSLSFDKFLTGYYTIHGMTYSWNSHDGLFTQELMLTRREWPIPNYSAVVQ